jgi:hypothetical protein
MGTVGMFVTCSYFSQMCVYEGDEGRSVQFLCCNTYGTFDLTLRFDVAHFNGEQLCLQETCIWTYIKRRKKHVYMLLLNCVMF